MSYGRRSVQPSASPLYVVTSSPRADTSFINKMIGKSGGRMIELHRKTIFASIGQAGIARNHLMGIHAKHGRARFQVEQQNDDYLLVYGTLSGTDTLLLSTGMGQQQHSTREVPLNIQGDCGVGIHRMAMLFEYPRPRYDWNDMLDFGINEKVVTPYTAYLVLERIEDYITYNITPPSELMEECLKRGWVKRDSRNRRKELQQKDDFDILYNVVQHYNAMVKSWNAYAEPVAFKRMDMLHDSKSVVVTESDEPTMMIEDVGGRTADIQEVVVTAYGTSRSKASAFSSTTVYQPMGNTSISIGQALEGKVPGISVQTSRGFVSPESILLRGATTLRNNNTPLYVLDGFPVEGDINRYVSMHNIESITVLKGYQATALYGSSASAGAIVISTKKYRKSSYSRENRRYKLKWQPEMYYMESVVKASRREKWNIYVAEKKSYGDDPLFYVDMAQHFYAAGYKDTAYKILLNASEVSDGTPVVLKSVAYVLESWSRFDEAAQIYEDLKEGNPYDLNLVRDLAWAQYMAGDVKQAAATLYDAIKHNFQHSEGYFLPVKASLMNDLNAMIAGHGKENFSFVPVVLIRPLPVDLRIVVTGTRNIYNLDVIDPKGKESSYRNPVSANKGRLTIDPYYYSSGEFNANNAIRGKYKLVMHVSSGNSMLPEMVRIISFKHFGRPGQTIQIQNVMLNNQWGKVEIGEVNF